MLRVLQRRRESITSHALMIPNRAPCYAVPFASGGRHVPATLARSSVADRQWCRGSICMLRPQRPLPVARQASYACAVSPGAEEKKNICGQSKSKPKAGHVPPRSSLKPPPVRRNRVPDPVSDGARPGRGNLEASSFERSDDGKSNVENDAGGSGAEHGAKGFWGSGGRTADTDALREHGSRLSGSDSGVAKGNSDAKRRPRKNMSLAERLEEVVQAIDMNASRGEAEDVEESAEGASKNHDTEGYSTRDAGVGLDQDESGESLCDEPEPIVAGNQQETDAVQDPTRDELIRLEGRESERSGDALLARELFRRCVELEPSNGKGWQDLAKVEGRIRGGLRRSASVLRRALSVNPENAYLWQSLGFLEYRMGRYEQARITFQDGLVVDPKHAPLYSTWGRMEGLLGNSSEARDLFKRGVEADPSCARLYYTWGVMELKGGKISRAHALFKKGLVIEPNNPFIWQMLGTMAVDNGEFDRARKCFDRALVDDCENVVVLDHWGRLECRLSNFGAAQDLFERGVRASPFDSRILQGWSLMELQRGNVEAARRLVKRAVTINSRDSILWEQFAKIEIAQGSYPRARALFKRATDVGPQDWRVWDNWSAMEFQLGNMEESAALLKRSFAIRFKASGEFTILANNIEDRDGHRDVQSPHSSA